MADNTWLDDLSENLQNDPEYQSIAVKMNIAEEISIAYKDKGWSKIELAEKLGTSPAYITKLLSGRTNFTVDTLVKLSDILKINLNLYFTKKNGAPLLNKAQEDIISTNIISANKINEELSLEEIEEIKVWSCFGKAVIVNSVISYSKVQKSPYNELV